MIAIHTVAAMGISFSNGIPASVIWVPPTNMVRAVGQGAEILVHRAKTKRAERARDRSVWMHAGQEYTKQQWNEDGRNDQRDHAFGQSRILRIR